MYNNKKIAVIIAAAGAGIRMNCAVPKQLMKINGKAMVLKTAEAFHRNGHIDHILIVMSEPYLEECRGLLLAAGIEATLIAGGERRQDSVYEGLKKLPDDVGYVLIHDGARPFVTDRIIDETVFSVAEKRAVVCAVPVKDTIRVIQPDGGSVTPDRSMFYSVQTPQAFEKGLIMDAYEKAYRDGYYGTDDGSLAERAGEFVHIIDGSYDNIKITTKDDLPSDRDVRVGTGFDAHAFEKGRKLVLGGVVIPFDRGLAGHSDADALTHAAIDAMLGAAGCGDIGSHFPDSEEEYKDIESLLLLERAAGLIRAKGYEIGNIDATVIAERPKVAPYTQEMARKMADALKISEGNINIKGTTTEGLGFTGREEGIAAQAVCTLYST